MEIGEKELQITDRRDTDVDLEDLIDSYLAQRFEEIRYDMYNMLSQLDVTLHVVGDDEAVIDFTEIESFMKEQNGTE